MNARSVLPGVGMRAVALAALLAGCASAPPMAAPPADLAIPAAWNGSAAPAAPGDALADAWWQGFGDPSLDALVERCLAGSFDLRQALARVEAAAALRGIAAGEALPQVDGSFDAQRNRRLFLGFPFGGGGVPSSTFTTYGLTLSARWELDVWGRVRSGESAAIADVQAAAADAAAARMSLVAQACRAHFAAVEQKQQLALAEATVATLRATYDDVRDRFRRGVRPALDVHQASANLASAEAVVAQRRDALGAALRRLDVLAGDYPRGADGVPATLPQAAPPIPVGVPSDLLLRRPDLAAAERRLAAAGCRVDVARASLYPRIALTGSAGTASTELDDLADNDFRVWSVGANLLAPLFRNGALRAEVARNEALLEQAAAGYGRALLQAFAEVEDVLGAEAQLAERRARTTDAAGHAVRARELARDRYQKGLVDFVTVAETQRQSFQADAARIALDRLCLDNRIDLFLALGGGYRRARRRSRPPVNAVRILLQILVPLAILGGGGFLAVRIARTAKKPAVVDAPAPPTLVQTLVATAQDVTFTVAAQGVVEPLRVAELSAEVPGRIVAVNPGLRAGALVAAGETLVTLDVADFEFAVAQQAAAVARAELRLAQERAEADAALRAWRELEGDTPPDALVARLPQIRDAEGALTAAQAALQKAERDRQRTAVKAPFAGRVRSVAAEIGQLAQPGQRLAALVDDTVVEVRLPVPVGEAAYVDLPLHDELPLGQGAPVAFTVEFAGAVHRWHGHVVRTEGEVDRRTRQLTVVARIEDARGSAAADGKA
ncbi:MAG: efflux transporter outer membrane subunit, partial [Planctomycetes bacterium]|nr:efflux transporter outer membrane subunit [Planctomycetota bacterium]